MDSNDVTLVVPCYNVADTLPRTLRAIKQLDPSPSSVLCVDDGSSDGTVDVVNRYEDVRLIKHERNKGLGAALNTALAHTATSLFAKVDADIVVPPDWLETMMGEMEKSGAKFIQGKFIEQVTTPADQWRADHVYPIIQFSSQPRRNKPINGSNILADVEALRDVNGWDEQFRRAFDDIDIMTRLIEAGYDVYYTPSVETTHVRTDTWEDVLHTAWSYSNAPGWGGKPTRIRDLFRRLPRHIRHSAEAVFTEAKKGCYRPMYMSFIQLFFRVKWDIESIQNHNT